VAYGARAISEGGWQSMPKMVAPGVALLGCSGGSGERAADQGQPQRHAVGQGGGRGGACGHQAGRAGDELSDYETEVRTGAIGRDLKKVRNVKPLWSKLGLIASLMGGGLDMWANTWA
jgi:electron-transferring-flavoprotein dehydrogenase